MACQVVSILAILVARSLSRWRIVCATFCHLSRIGLTYSISYEMFTKCVNIAMSRMCTSWHALSRRVCANVQHFMHNLQQWHAYVTHYYSLSRMSGRVCATLTPCHSLPWQGCTSWVKLSWQTCESKLGSQRRSHSIQETHQEMR